MSFLEEMAPRRRQRFMVPSVVVLLAYMVKTLLGIEHLHAMPSLLFTDPAMMKVMGFNARWMEEGLSRRSHEKRSEGKERLLTPRLRTPWKELFLTGRAPDERGEVPRIYIGHAQDH